MSSKTNSRNRPRLSRAEDILNLRKWMEVEEHEGVEGNFLCNWNIIENAHEEKELLVYIDGPTNIPAAYQVGGLVCPGILQVKHTHRRRGIGKKLVEYCIKRALRADRTLLYIQCKPSTSIPFWESMGFHLIEHDTQDHAYQNLAKSFPVPGSGVKSQIAIRFYPEAKVWQPATPPYVEYGAEAVRTTPEIISLPNRIQFHEKVWPKQGDTVVEVIVDNRSILIAKAKYEESSRAGLKSCPNGWYIDVISEAAIDV